MKSGGGKSSDGFASSQSYFAKMPRLAFAFLLPPRKEKVEEKEMPLGKEGEWRIHREC